MDLNITLGPYKFNLQATVSYRGPSMYSGHYATSVNYCEKSFYCRYDGIIECDTSVTLNSSTAYILLYKLTVGSTLYQTMKGGNNRILHEAGIFVYPIEYRSMNDT